ncbi:hypothetical protein P153DRAFT_383600 [Dothidotthia symphoricarpi CBS 119687]|uniref:Exonuclease domain-containing protein n=1 Tax=Dothidotthia symphoricarpi CBS 119687 TaxID=1392245 RepID=A0A6A6AHS6_9PLEO|nr:uncharacterized protein P153DRAFT_383600 [Dothidotthia symphoricarpi CBS 119687]KAF2131499.1 hypothetical protein P153DRAFT_383600 [Dothidotthia symphoricarpi CBS 119687]
MFLAGYNMLTTNDTSDQPGTPRTSRKTVRTPASTTTDTFAINVYKDASVAPENTPCTVPGVQEIARVLDERRGTFEYTSRAEPQGGPRTHAPPPNETLQPVEHASLYGLYMPYDINDCYLVAMPRNGGQTLVSPLVANHSGQDVEYGLLLPRLHQQAQSTSSANLGSCNSCGLAFTSWEHLRSHFQTSDCSILASRPPPGESADPPQSVNRQIVPDERSTVNTYIPEPQRSMQSNAHVLASRPKEKWSTIPAPQQIAALDALISHCHTYATLSHNKYTSGPGYANTPGAQVPLSLIPLPSPAHNPQAPRRGAVALDCEMVGVGVGVGKSLCEVARISAIDCLSGEILIDTLVQPTQPVTDWRTKYSGITMKAMVAGVAENRVLKGWPEARAELWKYVDSHTVLVGQALNHDLEALRMQHWRVVDAGILAKDAVGAGVPRRWGLKTLCTEFLGIDIQNHGNRGHDSVEDAFAAREVVLWCIAHGDELARWGRRQREECIGKMRMLEAKRRSSAPAPAPARVTYSSERWRWEWPSGH